MAIRAIDLKLIGLCLALAGAPAAASAQVSGPAPPVVPLGTQSATAPPPAVPTGPPGAGSSTEYLLGPEDVIDVEVVGQPDRARARVYADGSIQMNLIGKMNASGKTPRQLGDEIAQALKAGGYYANPIINVEVSSYASRYVTVLGAVGSPSLVPINRPYRLSEILARVGGVQPMAADYVIVRGEVGDEKRFMIDDLARGDSSKDPYVAAGDKIFAPVADVFYISGQVLSPGSFPMKSDMTARQAIARAGGLTPSGSDKKVEVTRGGKKIKLAGDAKVEPGDVLVVGERLF